MRHILLCIVYFSFSSFALAGSILKIKKGKILFSTEGMNNVSKGAEVIVQISGDEIVSAKVLKKGKSKALAKLLNPKHQSLIKKGDQVMTSGRGGSQKESSVSTGGNGFFIEPLINGYYGKGTYKSTATGSVTGTAQINMDMTGFSFGSLIGYRYNGFYISPWLSISLGTHSSITASYSTTPAVADVSFEDKTFFKNTIGGYLGYQITQKNRIWIFGGLVGMEAKTKTGGKAIYKGSNLGGGMSWKISEKVTANANLVLTTYSGENNKNFPFTETIGSITASADSFDEIYALVGISYYLELFR